MFGEYKQIVQSIQRRGNESTAAFRKADPCELAIFDLEEDLDIDQETMKPQVEARVIFSEFFRLSTKPTSSEPVVPTIIVTGYPPFIAEWTNKPFADLVGWSAEEVAGLDLRFLSGDGANGVSIKDLYDVVYTEQTKCVDQLVAYRRDGTLFSARAKCVPLHGYDRKLGGWVLSNIAITLHDCTSLHLFSSQILDSNMSFRDVGAPLDRRDYSEAYRIESKAVDLNDAVGEITDLALDEDYAISDIVRYASMTNTSAPIAITNR